MFGYYLDLALRSLRRNKALTVLMLGQAAVFAPARRASNVPPVVATRSV
jgi:hypothetical protein